MLHPKLFPVVYSRKVSTLPNSNQAHALEKDFYAAKTRRTALAEKGKNKTILSMKESAYLNKKSLDFRNPSAGSLHKHLGPGYDLRGATKKKVIGPKAAKRLGSMAGEDGKAIQYRSARTGGTNLFIPKKVFDKHPGVIRVEK